MKKFYFFVVAIVAISLLFSSCEKEEDDYLGTVVVEIPPVYPYFIRFDVEGNVSLPIEISYVYDYNQSGLILSEQYWEVESLPFYVEYNTIAWLYSSDSVGVSWTATSDGSDVEIKVIDYRDEDIILK